MKAEINQEWKAKFFAQYWNQYIGYTINRAAGKQYVGVHFIHSYSLPTHYLELKPLSAIADEDLIGISFTFPKDNRADIEFQFYPDDYNGHWVAKNGQDRKEGYFTLRDFDYLRSKSYALPFMGLSVDEMVQAGWIKLVK